MQFGLVRIALNIKNQKNLSSAEASVFLPTMNAQNGRVCEVANRHLSLCFHSYFFLCFCLVPTVQFLLAPLHSCEIVEWT